MKRLGCYVALIAGSATLVGPSAWAQDALGVKLGPGLRLYPELEFRTFYDTNFFYTPGAKEEAFGTLTRPAVGLVKEGNRFRLEGGVRAEIGEFDTGNEDDYVDVNYYTAGSYTLTSRHRVRGRLAREQGHDSFGLRRTEAAQSLAERELDEYTQDNTEFAYRFGATEARLNLEYHYRETDKRYDTNRSEGTRFLDYQAQEHTGTVYYNHSPRTALLLQGSVRDNEYPNNAPGRIPRDSDQTRLRVGATWEALAKTNARVLIGRLEHDPDAPARSKFTGFDWELLLDWTPTAKTTITLNTAREVDPSFVLQADFINTRQYIVGWQQRWAPRFRSALNLGYYDQDFDGFDRGDEFYRADFEVHWLLTRSFAALASISHLERDSNTPMREFDKEVLTLGFRYRL